LPKEHNKKKLYNVSEIAKMFNVSVSCIYKKAEVGEIDSIKIGSALRFSDQNINKFLKTCTRKKPPKRTRKI
jgi:excisionase family DNA binding protein